MLLEGLRYCAAFLEIHHAPTVDLSIVLASLEHLSKVLTRYHNNTVLVSKYEVARTYRDRWKSFFCLRSVAAHMDCHRFLECTRSGERALP